LGRLLALSWSLLRQRVQRIPGLCGVPENRASNSPTASETLSHAARPIGTYHHVHFHGLDAADVADIIRQQEEGR
jgi:hypothetical protein